jgi:hypothetical protein
MTRDDGLERTRDALNNPDLRVAFRDDVAPRDAKVYTELAMGLPFPVLVLNSSLREQWLADTKGFTEYLGELPDKPETSAHDLGEVYPHLPK